MPHGLFPTFLANTQRKRNGGEKRNRKKKKKKRVIESVSRRDECLLCGRRVEYFQIFLKKSIQQFQPSVTCVFLYLMWVGDWLLIAGRPSCFKSMANNIGQQFSIVSIKTNEFDCCSSVLGGVAVGSSSLLLRHSIMQCFAKLVWWVSFSFSLVFIFYNRLWQNKLLDCWDF